MTFENWSISAARIIWQSGEREQELCSLYIFLFFSWTWPHHHTASVSQGFTSPSFAVFTNQRSDDWHLYFCWWSDPSVMTHFPKLDADQHWLKPKMHLFIHTVPWAGKMWSEQFVYCIANRQVYLIMSNFLWIDSCVGDYCATND